MSKIPWTEKVWEVTGGCTECSTGCRECYARLFAWRFAHNPAMGDKYKGLVRKKVDGKLEWTGKIKLFEEHLEQPCRRKKPTMYFVDSRSDLFHPDVPFDFIDKVMAVIALCPQHQFQVLSKRPEIMDEYFNVLGHRYLLSRCQNLWLGVTAENQEMADKRIPILLQIPAAKRFVSIEPMLGVVDLWQWLGGDRDIKAPHKYDSGLSWVIVGAESGPGARYCEMHNVRNVVKQCKAAGVPVFVKQLHLKGKAKAIKDINQFPKDLQIQEWPK